MMEREIARAMARDMRQAGQLPRGRSTDSEANSPGRNPGGKEGKGDSSSSGSSSSQPGMVPSSSLPALRSDGAGWSEGNRQDVLNADSATSAAASVDDLASLDVSRLVEHCRSQAGEERAAGAALLRVATRRGFAAAQQVVEVGGVAPLVALLRSEDEPTVEHAVTALFNLSLEPVGRQAVASEAGVIPALVHVLDTGIPAARANSAAALFSLSKEGGDRVREAIIASGAVDPLVDLLIDGDPRAKRDAGNLLVSLCLLRSSRRGIAESGVIRVFCDLLLDGVETIEEAAAAVFATLVRDADGRALLFEEGGVPALAELVESGGARSREYAVNALLGLAVNSSACLAAIDEEGISASIDVLTRTGSTKTQAKVRREGEVGT